MAGESTISICLSPASGNQSYFATPNYPQPLFGESKRDNAMRVVVDLNKCLGYAQCVFLAPSVFKLNGEEALGYDPNPDDATRQKVLRAAAACPVQAILVEHLTDKAQEVTS
jgi:ferredoxin